MSTPAGWYDDGSGTNRYWDGTAWTSHTAPSGVAPPGPSVPQAPQGRTAPQRRRALVYVGIGAAVVLAAGGTTAAVLLIGGSDTHRVKAAEAALIANDAAWNATDLVASNATSCAADRVSAGTKWGPAVAGQTFTDSPTNSVLLDPTTAMVFTQTTISPTAESPSGSTSIVHGKYKQLASMDLDGTAWGYCNGGDAAGALAQLVSNIEICETNGSGQRVSQPLANSSSGNTIRLSGCFPGQPFWSPATPKDVLNIVVDTGASPTSYKVCVEDTASRWWTYDASNDRAGKGSSIC